MKTETTTYHPGWGSLGRPQRTETYFLERCRVCGCTYETQDNSVSWLSNLCDQHRESALRRDHVIRSIPECKRPMQGTLHNKLLFNHVYWLLKSDGREDAAREIEAEAIKQLRQDGMSDDLIYLDWKRA